MSDTWLTRAAAVAMIRESVLDLDPDREDHYQALICHPWRIVGHDPCAFRMHWREIVRMIEGGEIDKIRVPGIGWILLEAEKVSPWPKPAPEAEPAPAPCSECGGSGVIDLLFSAVACVCTDAFAGVDRGVAPDLPPQHPMCRCVAVEPEPSRRTLADVARAWGERSTAPAVEVEVEVSLAAPAPAVEFVDWYTLPRMEVRKAALEPVWKRRS